MKIFMPLTEVVKHAKYIRIEPKQEVMSSRNSLGMYAALCFMFNAVFTFLGMIVGLIIVCVQAARHGRERDDMQ